MTSIEPISDIEARALASLARHKAHALACARGRVHPDSFLHPDAKVYYAALQALSERGWPLLPKAIQAETKRQGHEVSTPRLQELTDPIEPEDAEPTQALLDLAAAHELRTAHKALEAYSAEMEPSDLDREALRGLLSSLQALVPKASSYESGSGDELIHTPPAEGSEHRPSIVQMQSPWMGIDEATGYMAPGRFWVVGASSGMGKTWFGLTLAARLQGIAQTNMGGRAARCLLISCEMDRSEIATRVEAIKLERTTEDLEASRRAGKEPEPTSLGIAYRCGPANISDIEATVKAQRERPDVVIVDYVQKLRRDDLRKGAGMVEHLEEISSRLKDLAQRERVCVIGLAQLNRSNQNDTKLGRPQIQHIKGSGAFEQDADAVLLLWRPEVFANKHIEDTKARSEAIDQVRMNYGENFGAVLIPKARHARNDGRGMVRMTFAETGEWKERSIMVTETIT